MFLFIQCNESVFRYTGVYIFSFFKVSCFKRPKFESKRQNQVCLPLPRVTLPMKTNRLSLWWLWLSLSLFAFFVSLFFHSFLLASSPPCKASLDGESVTGKAGFLSLLGKLPQGSFLKDVERKSEREREEERKIIHTRN